MRYRLLLLACLLAIPNLPQAAPSASLPVLIPADDERLLYTGRFDVSDPKAPRFDWSGVSIAARFKGTAIGFRLKDGQNDYNLTVDGKGVTVFVTAKGQGDYVVRDLPPGEHTAVLSKRTEAYFGTATFEGVLLPKGASLLPPPPRPERRIEFLGDSWSCGYGNEGKSLKCPDLRSVQNNDLAFGAVAAGLLGAERHVTAFSGRGIVRNYGEKGGASEDPFGVYFGRILANDPASEWDFRRWVPDVVVLCLGVNDFSTEPRTDLALFKEKYVELLSRVRAAYPKAWIVSYNHNGWPGFVGYVHDAVAEYKKGGDEKVLSWEFAPYPSEWHACDYHPGLPAHQMIGQDLAARLKPLFEEKTAPVSAVGTPRE